MQTIHAKIILLYKNGHSAQSIANETQVKLHTIYRVLKKHSITRRTANETNTLRFIQTPKSYQIIKKLSTSQQKLKTAALMLYWGEGAKTGNTVDFTNSSTLAHKVFLQYLRDICQVKENKLRFYLYCFEDVKPSILIKYWAEHLNIAPTQFTEPYIQKRKTPIKHARIPHGVLHIRYSDKRLLKEILLDCEALLSALCANQNTWVDTEAVKRG